MYRFYLTAYRLRKITAAEVWQTADDGRITAPEALKICGVRPK